MAVSSVAVVALRVKAEAIFAENDNLCTVPNVATLKNVNLDLPVKVAEVTDGAAHFIDKEPRSTAHHNNDNSTDVGGNKDIRVVVTERTLDLFAKHNFVNGPRIVADRVGAE